MLYFAAFQVAFFACMWLSKTLHVLFFEANGAVVNFSASYSAMALTGYFSFFAGHLTDVWGYRKGLALGCMLYALGLALRLFPDSFALAVTSGVIAGAGASTALGALRVWMVGLSHEGSRVHLVGVRSATNALGTGLGCALAGALPFLFSNDAVAMRPLLGLAAFGTFLLGGIVSWPLWSSLRPSKLFRRRRPGEISIADVGAAATKAPKPWQSLSLLFREHRRLTILTSVIGAMTGLYVSFISPYLPLIMKEKGLDMLSIGLSTGSFAIIRFLIDPFIAQWVSRHKASDLKIYLTSEVVVALITGAFLFQVSKAAFVILLLMRSASLGVSLVSEEVVWLRTFPVKSMGLFFGLNQSAFFVGDFIGGLMNGVLYKQFGLDICIQIVFAVMVVNGGVFYFFLRSKTSTPAAALV